MGYPRPSLPTLIARVIGDISSRTEGSAFIQAAAERFLAIMVAGVTHGVHGHLEWNVAQLLPTTADEPGLLDWGNMLEVERKPAQKATGPATFTGTNGTSLPLGTSLKADDDSLYTVTVAGMVALGSVIVTVEASEAGAAGNLENGATLSLLSPIAGIDTAGLVSGDGLIDGVDLEDLEDYRVRVVDELRNPESGGGPGSYVKWAKEIPGVTRAWEFGNRMGIGTVSLAFTMDEREDIIPTLSDVADVQAHIDSKKPLDMGPAYVSAPIAQPVDMTIDLVPNTTDVQDAVRIELRDLFIIEADFEGDLAQSRIDEAISSAQGETSHTITSIGSLSAADWHILTLGTLTFTG
jgi:uncharacterized phage protein gp47/JayE